MGATEAQELAEQIKNQETLGTQVVTKEVKVSKSLIDSRQQLINSIDANNEMRSDRPVTYRYVALDPSGKQVTNVFVAYSRVEVYTFLENEGYTVHCADSVQTATFKLEECVPDLVLLDVMLPDGNGMDFCTILRQKTRSHVLFPPLVPYRWLLSLVTSDSIIRF